MGEIITSEGNQVRPLMPVVWCLWLWWALASTVGWAVGGPLGVAVGSSMGNIIVAGSVGLAVGGIATGVLQSLLLRRHVARAGSWVVTIPACAREAVAPAGAGSISGEVASILLLLVESGDQRRARLGPERTVRCLRTGRRPYSARRANSGPPPWL